MTLQRTAAAAASSLAVLLALAGCGERPETETAGEALDSAASRTREAAGQARDEARERTASAANRAREAAGSVASTAREAAAESRDSARTAMMGAAAETRQSGTNMSQAAGAVVGDAQITSRVSASLMGDRELSKVRIDVDTRDGVVTLSGPVPSSTVKARANEVARSVRDVKSVDNQLTVSAS
jgi:hyperosmotically inducible protein